MGRMIRRAILIVLLAFTVAGCTSAAPPRAARPALWRIADADTTIYLFGTVHQLPAGLDWNSGPVARAIAESRQLVLELPPSAAPEIPRLFQAMALDEPVPPIATRIGTERAASLPALPGAFPPDRTESWALAVLLANRASDDAGLSAADGVEMTLMRGFTARQLPITGLESPREQLHIFDAMPPEEQDRFLSMSIDRQPQSADRIEQLVTAWSRGDLATMDAETRNELADFPDLLHALMVARNERWAAWVRHRLDQPGVLLVAVGAGHLAGDQSVPALLERGGVRVERVQ